MSQENRPRTKTEPNRIDREREATQGFLSPDSARVGSSASAMHMGQRGGDAKQSKCTIHAIDNDISTVRTCRW